MTLLCLGAVIFVFFSPLGKVRIGGRKARPIMSFSNLVWITLCTTVASGILFWGCAEPLYHFYQPAVSQGVEPGSAGAAVFAMKTMFLEWTLSPYAIYTVVAVLFAFVFYNMKQSYSIGSAFVPVFEYSNAIVHAFQKFRAPFSGKIVHIFPEQSAVI